MDFEIGNDPASKQLLQEIKAQGFESQNQTLINMGFTSLLDNLNSLVTTNGEVALAVSQLVALKPQQEEQSHGSDSGHSHYQPKQNHHKSYGKHKHNKHSSSQHSDANKLNIVDFTAIPYTIRKIFLDGNNMLFVDNMIRRVTLQNRPKAESLLSNLAFNFASNEGNFDTVLVYDQTNMNIQQTINSGSKLLTFQVLSASPSFKTSDDALVKWAEDLGLAARDCIFVTSDKELQERISNVGGLILRPKMWFGIVNSSLGEEKFLSIISQ